MEAPSVCQSPHTRPCRVSLELYVLHVDFLSRFFKYISPSLEALDRARVGQVGAGFTMDALQVLTRDVEQADVLVVRRAVNQMLFGDGLLPLLRRRIVVL